MTDQSWPPAPGDDAELSAYLSGELDEVASRRLETRLAEDPALAARLDEIAETLVRLRRVDSVSVPEGLAERVTAGIRRAQGHANADVAVPSEAGATAARRGMSLRRVPVWLPAAAAAIVAVVVIGGIAIVRTAEDTATPGVMEAADEPGTAEAPAAAPEDDAVEEEPPRALDAPDADAPEALADAVDPVATVTHDRALGEAERIAEALDDDAIAVADQRWDTLGAGPRLPDGTAANVCARAVDDAVEGTAVPVEIAPGTEGGEAVIAHLVVVDDPGEPPRLQVVVTEAETCAVRAVLPAP